LKPLAKKTKLEGTKLCKLIATVRITGVIATDESIKVGDVWTNIHEHESHGNDFDHYSKIQFLYNKDATEKIY
jgi:hypothetical protein